MKISPIIILTSCLLLVASCKTTQESTVTDNRPREGTTTKDPNAWDIGGEVSDEEDDIIIDETPPPPPTPKHGIKFLTSDLLRPLLDQAKREGKLVFVDFYATWCGPCKAMDRNVFSDKKIGEYFNENFISYKVDADGVGSHIAAIYDISNVPTLLFLDTDGEILVRRNSAAGISELKRMALQAQQKSGRSGGSGK